MRINYQIFSKIDKTEEKEFIEKQKNCLNIINNYSLENFSEAVKEFCIFINKKKKIFKIILNNSIFIIFI